MALSCRQRRRSAARENPNAAIHDVPPRAGSNFRELPGSGTAIYRLLVLGLFVQDLLRYRRWQRTICPNGPRVGLCAGQQVQHLADGAFPPVWFWQREMGLDVVAVAAAVFLLDDVAGPGQVGDDAEGAAFADVQGGRDVAQAYARVMSDAEENPGVRGQEGPARHPHKIPDSGKKLLVFSCGYML